jgi:rhodanese-related sulfurtransferase
VVLGINNTPSVEAENLEDLLQEGYQLIDVREQDEWDAGHHKRANHLPMGEAVEKIDTFNIEEKYIFVCRSGARSGSVTNFMISKNVESYNLTGGMEQLKNFTDEIYDSEGNSGQII